MSYKVYILYSDKIQKYYTGSTNDLSSRILHHNSGYNRSTKGGIPWRIVKVIEAMDRRAALRHERKIKQRGAARFISDCG